MRDEGLVKFDIHKGDDWSSDEGEIGGVQADARHMANNALAEPRKRHPGRNSGKPPG
jgi:hypothetical protein